MEERTLLFWRASPAVTLSAQEIARDLVWGEDVEGLIDLPVREILDRIKQNFSDNQETPGLLSCQTSGGSFEVTWSWQHLRVQHRGLPSADRGRLIDVVESFECMAYEAGA